MRGDGAKPKATSESLVRIVWAWSAVVPNSFYLRATWDMDICSISASRLFTLHLMFSHDIPHAVVVSAHLARTCRYTHMTRNNGDAPSSPSHCLAVAERLEITGLGCYAYQHSSIVKRGWYIEVK